jgi:hypothetical protein
MTEMQGIETTNSQPRFVATRKFLAKARKQVEIRALQGLEHTVRHRDLRLLAVQCAGAWVAFHGVSMYSPRVAWLLLGTGILLAVEMQGKTSKAG